MFCSKHQPPRRRATSFSASEAGSSRMGSPRNADRFSNGIARVCSACSRVSVARSGAGGPSNPMRARYGSRLGDLGSMLPQHLLQEGTVAPRAVLTIAADGEIRVVRKAREQLDQALPFGRVHLAAV